VIPFIQAVLDMANESISHNTGSQPQDGLSTQPHMTLTPEGHYDIRCRRILKHHITNSVDRNMVWTVGDPITRGGYTLDDGYYDIPYQYLRSSIDPIKLEDLHEKCMALKIKGYGFKVTMCNVQEQDAVRFGDNTKIYQVDAQVPTYWMLTMGEWLNPMWRPYTGDNFANVNDQLRMEEPETWDGGMLKRGLWELHPNHVEALDEINQLATISSRRNPPFEINKLVNRSTGTCKNICSHYESVDGRFIATCKYNNYIYRDYDNPGFQQQQYLFPNSLTPYNQKWSLGDYAYVHEKNRYQKRPPSCCIRLDRVPTQGGDLVRNAVIEVEYFCEMAGIPHTRICKFSFRNIVVRTGGDPWALTISRRWAALIPGQVSAYNVWGKQVTQLGNPGTFHNEFGVKQDYCKRTATEAELLDHVKATAKSLKISTGEFIDRYNEYLKTTAFSEPHKELLAMSEEQIEQIEQTE